jgi:glycosyltransferase involved in cell wall biosynthesis
VREADSVPALVSIVIPVKNGGNYLREAIDSAVAQTYPDVEIVVVDDGSDDGGITEEIARSYGPRIRYHAKPNGGVASALNHAIREARGEYISWLSHDDLYHPEKVAQQVAFLRSLEQAQPDKAGRTVVFSDYGVFTETPLRAHHIRLQPGPPENFRYWITTQNVLHGCSLLVPRSAFSQCWFDETLRTTQDYDLWFRLAQAYAFHHLPSVLIFARAHPQQGTVAMADTAHREINELLSRFILALSPAELKFATGVGLGEAYLRVWMNFSRRGFGGAAETALRLVRRHRREIPWLARLSALAFWLWPAGLAGSLRRFYSRHPILRRARHAASRTRRMFAPDAGGGGTLPVGLPKDDLKAKFSMIYHGNLFAGRMSRSGEGSDLIQTATIRRELPRLLCELDVRSMVDAPCGDWFWMQHVDFGNVHYHGIDIIDELIVDHRRRFGSPTVSFSCADLRTADLPKADLIFCRDCLVHLGFADALALLGRFKASGSTYLLTTTFPAREENADPAECFWAPLNLERSPFSLPPPLRLINEGCTEENGAFADKSLGLWRLSDLQLDDH